MSTAAVHLTLQTRVMAALLGLLFDIVILELIRRHRLQERYTLFWLLVGFGLVLCGVVPGILKLAADVLGVRDTNVALFAIVIGGLTLVVLHLTVVISQQSEHITRLAQELAIARSDSDSLPRPEGMRPGPENGSGNRDTQAPAGRPSDPMLSRGA